MARPAYGGRTTCGSCRSINVRRWHRDDRLRAGQLFTCSWTRHGEPADSISVRTEPNAVVLMCRSRSWGAAESTSVEQRVSTTWTACHFGGHRPWFICSGHSGGRSCGRRVAVLYQTGGWFACRRCCGLAYMSQQESPIYRGLAMAQKIRKRLGGSSMDIFDMFPAKPKGMHWRTYERLRLAYEAAKERAMKGLARMGGGGEGAARTRLAAKPSGLSKTPTI
jgi:hypothetical protein